MSDEVIVKGEYRTFPESGTRFCCIYCISTRCPRHGGIDELLLARLLCRSI